MPMKKNTKKTDVPEVTTTTSTEPVVQVNIPDVSKLDFTMSEPDDIPEIPSDLDWNKQQEELMKESNVYVQRQARTTRKEPVSIGPPIDWPPSSLERLREDLKGIFMSENTWEAEEDLHKYSGYDNSTNAYIPSTIGLELQKSGSTKKISWYKNWKKNHPKNGAEFKVIFTSKKSISLGEWETYALNIHYSTWLNFEGIMWSDRQRKATKTKKATAIYSSYKHDIPRKNSGVKYQIQNKKDLNTTFTYLAGLGQNVLKYSPTYRKASSPNACVSNVKIRWFGLSFWESIKMRIYSFVVYAYKQLHRRDKKVLDNLKRDVDCQMDYWG